MVFMIRVVRFSCIEMRNSLLPESNAEIIILGNVQSDYQPDGPRLQRSWQFLQRIMNVILAIITGILLLIFLIRRLGSLDSVGRVHNYLMPEISMESPYGNKGNWNTTRDKCSMCHTKSTSKFSHHGFNYRIVGNNKITQIHIIVCLFIQGWQW